MEADPEPLTPKNPPAAAQTVGAAGRSPELMTPTDTALVVVDVQQKLLPAIADHERLLWNIVRLVRGTKLLGVPILATEQYPRGLGPTVPELAELLPKRPAKTAFSCCGCAEWLVDVESRDFGKLLLAGIEAHVCVQQTALDLVAAGRRVYVAVDAVGSRSELDREVALRRMDSAGVTLTTVEAALFEWCGTAERPEFKDLSRLVREAPIPNP